jgi:hypothetical protein
MRLAILISLCCAVPCFSQGAACDSAAQIIEANGQLMIRNISDKSIVDYFIAETSSKSQGGKSTRTYRGTFTEGDSLGPGRSLEIGRADMAAAELSVDYVRFADRWQCGEAPPEGPVAQKPSPR